MIEVIKPGLLSTVQDQGRWGYQAYGVGISGAMDSLALAAGNLLVGNPERAAGLEMTLQGPSLKFHGETWFAVTGADLGPRLDGSPISSWAAHRAPSGSVLSFGSRRSGVRAYLSVAGGLDVPVVMDSRSTYLLGRFGGLEGRPLKAQDRLPVGFEAQVRPPREGFVFPESLRPAYRKNPRLRAVLGPFQDFFSEEGMAAFLSEEYLITPSSDRMGYRLQGKPVTRKKTGELITCGLANGTVQVPPNGQPIILLADRQTIGGYPIIATVIHADLSLVAQCAPGDKVRFGAVSPDEAREAYLSLWGPLKKFPLS
jgi:antagonist of KipI